MKDTEIEIPNYELFRCDTDGIGGSLLYIHIVACKEVDDIGFDEAVWKIVKLTNNDKF